MFDFQHLILLIGTNPLPNFVVGDYFLNHNENLQKIWLIHEEVNRLQGGTNVQADNLEKLLKTKWNEKERKHRLQFPLEKISISDVSHTKTIRHDVQDKMIVRLANNKVHLNYTGGTKDMSAHMYCLLKDKMKDNSSFSYLDSRGFRLIDDDNDEVIADDLRKEVSISFQELINLQGFERFHLLNKDDNFEFSNSLAVFEKMIDNGELNLFYDMAGGYSRKLFENKKGRLAERVEELDREKINAFIPNDAFKSIIMQMPKEYPLLTNKGEFNWEIPNKKLKKTVNFLDGLWLKHYVAKSILEKLKLVVLQNWTIKKPEWTPNLGFELDVILLNGYQLTGIACTTDDTKEICKSKGFEIINRTRQIGGDEAKAVLVTKLKTRDTNNVQEELIHDTGGDKNILVLGIEDLKKEKLVSSIKKFIEEKLQ